MPKTEVLRLRLTPEELARRREAAGSTSLSSYVRRAVNARVKLEAVLREEDERRAHANHMQREAARRLAEAQERRDRPGAADVLAALDEVRPYIIGAGGRGARASSPD
jgi:hypothetical protein